MKTQFKNIFSTRKVLLFFTVLISLSYFRTIDAPFQFDDGHTVESNVTIRTLRNIPLFWTDAGTSSLIPENRNFRPLLFTGYAFCWWIAGGATWPFHLFKLLLHIGISVAFFLIWRRLYRIPGMFPVDGLYIRIPFWKKTWILKDEVAAFMVATLFALHPAASECVIYVASTSSLQAAFFYTWAFWFYLQYKDHEKPKWLYLALFFYFLSSASKEEGITFPLMVFITEYFLLTEKNLSRRQRFLQSTVQSMPFILLGALLAIWIVFMLPSEGGESRGRLTPLSYFVTQWGAYLWYLKLWFWPFGLNADDVSMLPIKSIADSRWIEFAFGNILVLVFAIKLRRVFPLLLFGLAWFYISLAPTSSFIPLAEMVNERRMYLGYVGFAGAVFPLVLLGMQWLLPEEKRKRRLGWLFCAVLTFYFVGVQERNRVWSSTENLWQDTLDKNPQSGRARNNLALVYMGRGDFEAALKLLQECENIWSTYPVCSLNKAISLQALHRYDEAEASYKRTLSLQPTGTHANFNAGVFYMDVRKDYKKAAAFFATSANATGGRYPAALVRYAMCNRELGAYEEARKALGQALSLDSNDFSAWFELGRVEISSSHFSQAKGIYERILQVSPDHWGSWYNLAFAEKGLNNNAKALEIFTKVISALPNDLSSWIQIEELSRTLKNREWNDRALSQIKLLRQSSPGESVKPSASRQLSGLKK